ncbi:hypothetical protein QTQ03_16595 [Micromonospora sp. WMMA1363]|uniref:hypothetical protein n=1 Tax=Micromonospora sp. WMMA1363 TaxID=3053985 RepID=UPI00259CD734|nr:hypothetical protein [Micromonospora sp. WMMA1363]MDM4721138.1 hypothetical protein [Micromonospora sp. WMMA1363]
MTDTGSNDATTQGEKRSHRERHASISDRNARTKARIDTSDASSQVTKSRGAEKKVTPPLPREVTFSAPSLQGRNVTPRGGEINKNSGRDADPEPVGAIAERVLDDLAARQAEALNRLARAHRKENP